VVLGSVVDMNTVNRVNELIDDAVAKGAKIVRRQGRRHPDGRHADRRRDAEMRIFRETFAPVKAIVRVRGEEQAIAMANDNEFGLSSAVFTRDTARGWRVAGRIEAGICHVNGPTVHDEAQMPFGGVKNSGYGHFGGQAGIDAFTDTRWITMQTTHATTPSKAPRTAAMAGSMTAVFAETSIAAAGPWAKTSGAAPAWARREARPRLVSADPQNLRRPTLKHASQLALAALLSASARLGCGLSQHWPRPALLRKDLRQMP
jgi:delta 1-pyrroline-5-carboxylate dehydrogenase